MYTDWTVHYLLYLFTFQQRKAKVISSSDRALEYFDNHYKLVLGNLWPSVRISLLTQKKTCAILNNYCEANTYYTDFLDAGAFDIIEKARKRQHYLKRKPSNARNELGKDKVHKSTADGDSSWTDNVEEDEDKVEDIYADMDRKNLDLFIPATRVLPEITEERIEEARQSIYTPKDVRVDIVAAKRLNLPEDLSVVAFPAGDVSMLPEPKVDRPHGQLCMWKLFYINL